MLARLIPTLAAILCAANTAFGQAAAAESGTAKDRIWLRAGETASGSSEKAVAGTDSRRTSAVDGKAAGRRITRVTHGDRTLPNQHGQVWREYDIAPYTLRVTTTKRPEQAILDWILQETGYEAWHGEPLAVLSATPRTLRVYHTPEIQAVVANLVDRFVSSEAETYTFSLRVATVDHPNWRARAKRLLRPVPVQTSGVNAWLMHKEEAAILLAELRRRTDYREHSSPHLLVNNGQSTVVSARRSRSFIREVLARADVWPGFEADMGQVDEGYSLEFNPLLTADRRMIDATIKCNIDQVEKMLPVVIDVPTQVAPRQRTKVEVPQIAHFRFHERFRWPVDQVLLVGMGVVALPVPVDPKPLVPGLPLPFGSSPPRADLLVFLEAKGQAHPAAQITRSPQRPARTYRGRY